MGGHETWAATWEKRRLAASPGGAGRPGPHHAPQTFAGRPGPHHAPQTFAGRPGPHNAPQTFAGRPGPHNVWQRLRREFVGAAAAAQRGLAALESAEALDARYCRGKWADWHKCLVQVPLPKIID